MLSREDILRRKNMWDTVLNRVRLFFKERGFSEFRTPILVRTPGMEPYLDPFKVQIKTHNPAREIDAGLITSPEFSMKKLLGAGFERIFTITPVFRNNEALGPHNWPEFTMLEWYAGGTYEDMMAETEALYRFVLEDDQDWPRFTYEDAGMDEFGDPHVNAERFFVTHFPASQAALAKLTPDGKYAQRFESYADGLELSNGFADLTDATEQRRRFEADIESRKQQVKSVFPMDEAFLESIGKIDRPVYGNSIGIDRLVMLKYGIGDIREIQLFPSALEPEQKS